MNIVPYIKLFRLNRTVMVASVTFTGAFCSGAGLRRSLLMALGAWFLAVGGFSLDFLADRELDMHGPRSLPRHNPLADGSVSPRFGLFFPLTFLAASLVTVACVSAASLVYWAAIVTVVAGLALHLFETPVARALTLGLLQALYALMGGSAGILSIDVMLFALLLLFAMTGGRGMTDIRDFPQDAPAPVQTLPKRYGVRRTAVFTGVMLFVSFIIGICIPYTGRVGAGYLWFAVPFVIIGSASAVAFIIKPSPRLAHVFTYVCMMGLGTLICAAMIAGHLTG